MERVNQRSKTPERKAIDFSAEVIRRRGLWKRREDIIASGTLKDKLEVLFISAENSRYFGREDEQISREQEEQIKRAINKNKRSLNLADRAIREREALIRYGEKLEYIYQRYISDLAYLAIPLNEWSVAERMARDYTKTLKYYLARERENATREERILIDLWRMRNKAYLDGAYKKETRSIGRADFEKHRLFYDEETETIKAVEGEGFKDILEEFLDNLIFDMTAFKSYDEVFTDFFSETLTEYCPTEYYIIQDVAMEERLRDFIEDEAFFCSTIEEREANGETITPEERKMAIIPTYRSIKADEEIKQNCRILIDNILTGKQ